MLIRLASWLFHALVGNFTRPTSVSTTPRPPLLILPSFCFSCVDRKPGGLQLSRASRGPERHVAGPGCSSTRRWKQGDSPSPHAHRPGVGPEIPGAEELRGYGGARSVGPAPGEASIAATFPSFRPVVKLVTGCWLGRDTLVCLVYVVHRLGVEDPCLMPYTCVTAVKLGQLRVVERN